MLLIVPLDYFFGLVNLWFGKMASELPQRVKGGCLNSKSAHWHKSKLLSSPYRHCPRKGKLLTYAHRSHNAISAGRMEEIGERWPLLSCLCVLTLEYLHVFAMFSVRFPWLNASFYIDTQMWSYGRTEQQNSLVSCQWWAGDPIRWPCGSHKLIMLSGFWKNFQAINNISISNGSRAQECVGTMDIYTQYYSLYFKSYKIMR